MNAHRSQMFAPGQRAVHGRLRTIIAQKAKKKMVSRKVVHCAKARKTWNAKGTLNAGRGQQL